MLGPAQAAARGRLGQRGQPGQKQNPQLSPAPTGCERLPSPLLPSCESRGNRGREGAPAAPRYPSAAGQGCRGSVVPTAPGHEPLADPLFPHRRAMGSPKALPGHPQPGMTPPCSSFNSHKTQKDTNTRHAFIPLFIFFAPPTLFLKAAPQQDRAPGCPWGRSPPTHAGDGVEAKGLCTAAPQLRAPPLPCSGCGHLRERLLQVLDQRLRLRAESGGVSGAQVGFATHAHTARVLILIPISF